jgi:hypothetical protein
MSELGESAPEMSEQDMANLPPGRLMSVRRSIGPSSKWSHTSTAVPGAGSIGSSESGSTTQSPTRRGGSLSVPPLLQTILKRRLLERSGSFEEEGVSNSRSTSPLPKTPTPSTVPTRYCDVSLSSMSSLEDFVDDLLTDRNGLEEVSSRLKGASSISAGLTLPSVNERMSEETLEDSHAFSDISALMAPASGGGSRSCNASRASFSTLGTGAGGVRLGPLDEEGDDTDFDSDSECDKNDANAPPTTQHLNHPAVPLEQTQVIVTNIENVTIHHDLYNFEDDEESMQNLPPGRMLVRRGSNVAAAAAATKAPTNEQVQHSPASPRRKGGALSIPPQLQTILRRRLSAGSSTATAGESVDDEARRLPRAASPSMEAKMMDHHNSNNNLEELVEDLLTDKHGLEGDLEGSASRLKFYHAPSLPSVMERMTEDALEDVHAFTDLNVVSRCSSSNASRASVSSFGTGAGGARLGPLDEEEGTDFDSDSDQEKNTPVPLPEQVTLTPNGPTHVIVTNIENLTLHHDQSLATRTAGESVSLLEEAPSAPV